MRLYSAVDRIGDKICEAEKQIDANGVIRERVEVI